jgi:hypothetical protein
MTMSRATLTCSFAEKFFKKKAVMAILAVVLVIKLIKIKLFWLLPLLVINFVKAQQRASRLNDRFSFRFPGRRRNG